MSLKLSTSVSLEDWGNYIRSNMQHIVKWTKIDLEGTSAEITVNKSIELIFQLNNRIDELLGYKSHISSRFAPKFSRFLFFDVEKEGSLHQIIRFLFKYFEENKIELNIAKMSLDKFKQFYNSLYDYLLSKQFIDSYTFCLQTAKSEQAKQIIQYFRAGLTEETDDADFIITDSTEFIPSIPPDFQEMADKIRGGANEKSLCNFIDLNKQSNINKYFLRLTEQIENKKQKNNVICHVRCIPQDFDVALALKDFISIRQKQTETQQVLELDEFPDKIYYKNDVNQPVMIPFQFLTDSSFFNEFLLPLDYVNSIQELQIEKAQQKFTKKVQQVEASNTNQLSSVEQWKCKQRQAENKPPHRHLLNSTMTRGFESYNQKQLLQNNLVRAQQDRETSTHLHLLLQSGVLFAGVPVSNSVVSHLSNQERQRQVGRTKKINYDYTQNNQTLSFFVRYYQKLDFSIHCNLKEILGLMQHNGFQLDYQEQVSYIEKNTHKPQQAQLSPINEQFLKQPGHMALVQQERFKKMIAEGQIKFPEWFSPEKLSEFELNEFKDDLPTDQIFQIRNQMICAWRCLPHMHLQLTSLAEFIQVDYFILKKIYKFYQDYELINHPLLVMKSTLPVKVFQNPIEKQVQQQIQLQCSNCQLKFTNGFYSSISKFVCAVCVEKCIEKDKFVAIETTTEWSQADCLVLLEKIRQNLQNGVKKLFKHVGDALKRDPMECLSQFLKLQFGQKVNNSVLQEKIQLTDAIKRAIVRGRVEEARGYLELEKVLLSDQ